MKRVLAFVKCAAAIAVMPIWPLVWLVPGLFLPVFSWLWPHLDILGDDGSLYLRRFFITPKTRWFRPRFLHYIARSDEGRDPHDHPNSFRTTILRGGYDENVYYPKNQVFRETFGLFATRELRPGDTVDNPFGHTHMVTLIAPTWSWVVGWNGGGRWGFWVLSQADADSDRWIDSEDYGAKGQERKSWA